MDMNEYLAIWLVRERLAEARAVMARRPASELSRPFGQLPRAALGPAAVRLGRAIMGLVSQYFHDPGARS